jgi:hypothetical protein
MRKWARMVFLLTVTLMSISGWSLPPQVVDVVDKSEFQNAVQYVGKFSFGEQFIGGQLLSSCGDDISARNISGKAIVLFVASLKANATLGGCRLDKVFQFDNVFSGHPVEPEANFKVSHQPYGTDRQVSQRRDTVGETEEPDEPKAEVRTLYIEFADGTAVGDKRAAEDILHTRNMILSALQQLESIYKVRGEAAFASLLNTKLAGDADWFFDRVRATAKDNGIEPAFEQVQNYLGAAGLPR